MIKKTSLILLAIALTFSLLLGCSKKTEQQKENLKEELIEAINMQSDIVNYRFKGSAELMLDWPALTGQSQDPLTAGFTSMLTNSTISWQGVADLDKTQMEIDLKLTPRDVQATFEVPALINNSKLYIQIPLLAANDDEYLTFDLDGDLNNLPFTPILLHLIEAIDAKYFAENSNDNTSEKIIAIEITTENAEELVSSFLNKLPAIVTELENSKLLNTEQVETWQKEGSQIVENITIEQPGALSFTVNEAGFIVEQNITLHFDNQSININNRFDEINQSVAFEKEIPVQVRPIEDMLEQFR